MDFKLIASTPAADLERVEEIELEVLGDSTSRVPCSALYEGQERCSKVVANLASLGFVSTSACHPMHKAMVCERSMRFLRRQAAPLPLPARADVRLWRQKLQRGNCLPYVVTGYRGDCEYGSQGELFWQLGGGQTDEMHFIQHCLAECSRCARCRFISLSTTARVCSWHATCDISNLTNIYKWTRYTKHNRRLDSGYQSAPVAARKIVEARKIVAARKG
mmetsp:Transcript_64663/g.107438  ORF Transcript_64663/g.107438 Transcript_64663/m.107438 type:complete len:219 (+) Transcript_64663:141-797(+)